MKTLYIACALPSVQLIGLCCTRQNGLWGKNIRLFLWYILYFLRDVRHFLKNVRCFFKYVCCFLKTNGIARNRPWHQCACAVLQIISVLENVNFTDLSPSRARARARIGQEFYAFYFHICHTQPKILKLRVLPCDRLHFNKTRTVTPSFFSVWQQNDSNFILLSPLSAHVY